MGAWYRPPGSDSRNIETCEQEHDTLAGEALGTLLLGDLNVHHKEWLIHSGETSSDGKRMRLAAAHMGLRQLAKEPTRGKNLLDLALSDIPGAKASVHPKIADHSIVEVCMPLPVPEVLTIEREVWQFRTADWERSVALLQEEDWSDIASRSPDDGAARLSNTLLQHASSCIRRKKITEKKSTHPWLNDAVLQAVSDKRNSEGT